MIRMRMPAIRDAIGWRCAMLRVILRLLVTAVLRKAADLVDETIRGLNLDDGAKSRLGI